MRTFTNKGYGRIYIEKKEDKEIVEKVIKEIDEFEHFYLPEDLITEIAEFPELVFTHKFDSIDLDYLTIRCQKLGINIICIDAEKYQYMTKECNGFNLS